MIVETVAAPAPVEPESAAAAPPLRPQQQAETTTPAPGGSAPKRGKVDAAPAADGDHNGGAGAAAPSAAAAAAAAEETKVSASSEVPKGMHVTNPVRHHTTPPKDQMPQQHDDAAAVGTLLQTLYKLYYTVPYYTILYYAFRRLRGTVEHLAREGWLRAPLRRALQCVSWSAVPTLTNELPRVMVMCVVPPQHCKTCTTDIYLQNECAQCQAVEQRRTPC